LSKTSQFKTVCKEDSGYITQLKQQKSKKVILLVSTLTMWSCASKTRMPTVTSKGQN